MEYGLQIRPELNPSQDKARKKEDKIMGVIAAHSLGGISHIELAQIVGLNRKNLTSYMKRLMKKRLVLRGRGKQGKYFPANKDYRATTMTAELFSKACAARILHNSDFAIRSHFFKVLESDELENALFTFSNKIGAIITYLLIQSMNPSNKFMGDTKHDEEKDLEIERWVDDAISSLRPILLPEFKEYISPSNKP
jgi:hypothetical protein